MILMKVAIVSLVFYALYKFFRHLYDDIGPTPPLPGLNEGQYRLVLLMMDELKVLNQRVYQLEAVQAAAGNDKSPSTEE